MCNRRIAPSFFRRFGEALFHPWDLADDRHSVVTFFVALLEAKNTSGLQWAAHWPGQHREFLPRPNETLDVLEDLKTKLKREAVSHLVSGPVDEEYAQAVDSVAKAFVPQGPS